MKHAQTITLDAMHSQTVHMTLRENLIEDASLIEIQDYKFYETRSIVKSTQYYFPIYNENYGFVYLNVTVNKDEMIT